MRFEQVPIYECLNLQPIVLPNSSYFYSLEPIGLGTPYGESLTSYINRLADAHCIRPGTLFRKLAEKFNSITGKSYVLSAGCSYGTLAPFNGTGIVASDWVRTLEELTLQNNLMCLTLIRWGNVIPYTFLLRRNKAWCPLCYAEWDRNKLPVYDLLGWAISAIEVCLKHRCRLTTQCRHCNNKMKELGYCSRPGYCSRCREWLGEPSEFKLETTKQLEKQEIEWQEFVWDNLGQLLSVTALLPPSKGTINRTISECINQVTDGNTAEFARFIHLPKNTVWMWKAGKVIPSLNHLLRICYCLQIPLLTLFTGEFDGNTLDKVRLLPQGRVKRVVKLPSRKFNSEKVQSLLEEAFISHRCPPPSMKNVAQELGYDSSLLRKYFPELCKMISQRYIAYIKCQRLQRKKKLRGEVRQVAVRLYSEGIYPSTGRVAKQLAKPGSIRDPDGLAELHKVQAEISQKVNPS